MAEEQPWKVLVGRQLPPMQDLRPVSTQELDLFQVQRNSVTLLLPNLPGHSQIFQIESFHGIHCQARILKWAAISFSRGSSRPRDRTRVSHIAEDNPEMTNRIP
ncbi:unnamed protein product [Rangifer tarandus platyrhynchus]|uniref:Uncharacterized protein n=2 Tax=Rangifer tarandus platyrhynchus TaxID=3082113 RepID=A0AC59ZF72_RANTA|nr:unnamed protein product [Rangifer tarandus platyrhynchus]